MFKNVVANQLSRKIKLPRIDRGGEYKSPFGELYSQHGIIHQTTAPYSFKQNGVAKGRNNYQRDDEC